MITCKKCRSTRVAEVGGKCSDMCDVYIGEKEHHGYVPSGMGIGGSDNIDFNYCLNCGQIDGDFPIAETELEKGEEDDEEDD